MGRMVVEEYNVYAMESRFLKPHRSQGKKTLEINYTSVKTRLLPLYCATDSLDLLVPHLHAGEFTAKAQAQEHGNTN